MVKFTAEERRELMDLRHNIRNMSVVGHVSHGKSTLTDSLIVAAADIIHKEDAGDVHMIDTHADEAGRGMTIKSTGISLCYEMTDAALKAYQGERDGNMYLFNLIDSPGEVDFSSEVTAALRISDGALVVVDCIDGVGLHTVNVLHQALSERIRPVLAISKLDRCFLELQVDGEEVYQTFRSVIEDVNDSMRGYEDPKLGDVKVSPEKGTVAFSAGLHGWAFTLTTFARMYASEFGCDESKILERLWGENYYDPNTKKWTTESTGSPTCTRGFVRLCYEPIKKMIDTCMNDEKDLLWTRLTRLTKQGVTLNSEEKELTGDALMKCVMQKWLPAAAPLVEMMISHLPSPKTAQEYRMENLYKGDLEDPYAKAIKTCDPDGPLMIYISKMFPASEKGSFFAFGRVFAGRVSTGLEVRIMGPKYVPGQEKDLYVKTVEKVVIWMGKEQENVEDVPCGNTVALLGLDKSITRTATLTHNNGTEAYPICAMKLCSSPVVRVAVHCKDGSNLKELVDGLKSLALSDTLVNCTVEESGERIIAGAGELHLEKCLKDLKEKFMDGAEIEVGKPFVSLRETVMQKSSHTVMSMSSNGQNRLFMRARPLSFSLTYAIENGRVGPSDNSDARGKILSEEYGLKKYLGKKIWCFGPETTGPNMVVGMCKGGQSLNGIEDSVVAAFQEASKIGVLANELMTGISFEVRDALLHADPAYRDNSQIIKTAQRVIYASQLTAEPRFMQPLYKVGFRAPEYMIDGIHSLLKERRGSVYWMEKVQRLGTSLYDIRAYAYLPVINSFGFSGAFKNVTEGKVIPQSQFAFWDLLYSNPLEAGSYANTLVTQIRKRKGLKEQITPLSDFEDQPDQLSEFEDQP